MKSFVGGTDSLIHWYSSNHKRKLAAGYIDKFEIQIQDINQQKITFNSGKIVLDIDIFKK